MDTASPRPFAREVVAAAARSAERLGLLDDDDDGLRWGAVHERHGPPREGAVKPRRVEAIAEVHDLIRHIDGSPIDDPMARRFAETQKPFALARVDQRRRPTRDLERVALLRPAHLPPGRRLGLPACKQEEPLWPAYELA